MLMSEKHFGAVRETTVEGSEAGSGFTDMPIPCIDCKELFIWTAGEQAFFRDKELKNPPKRCKECKKAKNLRLEAIEMARVTGKRHRIEVRANCDRCETATTVPFYPCQGRPVYCRACFLAIGAENVTGANGNIH